MTQVTRRSVPGCRLTLLSGLKYQATPVVACAPGLDEPTWAGPRGAVRPQAWALGHVPIPWPGQDRGRRTSGLSGVRSQEERLVHGPAQDSKADSRGHTPLGWDGRTEGLQGLADGAVGIRRALTHRHSLPHHSGQRVRGTC